MINPHIVWFELHMRLKNACFIVSFIFSYTEGRFAYFIRSKLATYWWWCVV